ncbi:hypothetical protein WNZ14_21875 [Hoeflea sp. AS60]|uniref:hypothetical protein n=1 Tax=Hoeflea sp. AS60 TaxID=3135780 RepID=UPI00317C693D
MTSAPAPEPQSRLPQPMPVGGMLPLALGLIAAAMASGAAFAAWQANGPAILNALGASGLAWCL